MNLPFGGAVLAHLPLAGGLVLGSSLDAALTVLHPSGNPLDYFTLADWKLFELDLRPMGYDVLVGRDVLARLRFLYDGPGGRFELEW